METEKKLHWITNTDRENIPFFQKASEVLGCYLEIRDEVRDYQGRLMDFPEWCAIYSNASFKDLVFEKRRYKFINLLEKNGLENTLFQIVDENSKIPSVETISLCVDGDVLMAMYQFLN